MAATVLVAECSRIIPQRGPSLGIPPKEFGKKVIGWQAQSAQPVLL